MEQLSTTARDQSIWSSRASQSSSAKWIRSHTPACCQSRKRRQHVIPDPHPSSCGSICQGIPLRRTKTMPVRHARSETRGRPPWGRRGGIGKNGSTRSHNGSGSSAAAIPIHTTSPKRDQVSEVLLHALKNTPDLLFRILVAVSPVSGPDTSSNTANLGTVLSENPRKAPRRASCSCGAHDHHACRSRRTDREDHWLRH